MRTLLEILKLTTTLKIFYLPVAMQDSVPCQSYSLFRTPQVFDIHEMALSRTNQATPTKEKEQLIPVHIPECSSEEIEAPVIAKEYPNICYQDHKKKKKKKIMGAEFTVNY